MWPKASPAPLGWVGGEKEEEGVATVLQEEDAVLQRIKNLMSTVESLIVPPRLQNQSWRQGTCDSQLCVAYPSNASISNS